MTNCKCGDRECDDHEADRKDRHEELAAHILDDAVPVWSTCAESHARAKTLYVIRAIVDKYGGTVEIDLESERLNIDFPDDVSEEDEAECALEVEQAMLDAGFDVG